MSALIAPWNRLVHGETSTMETAFALEALAVGLMLLFQFTLSTYRLYLHPLAKFPGTTAACRSNRWEYDLGKAGFPEHEYERLHKKFNSRILRIRPNELHITDPAQYKVLYNQKTPFLKDAHFYAGFPSSNSFTETDPARHRKRRKMLNNMFARAGVFKLEPLITEKINTMNQKLRRLSSRGPINIYNAFRCLTTEIIQEFAFSRSTSLIEESPNDFGTKYLTVFDTASKAIADFQYSPLTRIIANMTPKWILKLASDEMAGIVDLQKYAADSAGYFQKNGNTTSHPVVFEVLTAESHEAQVSEAINILIAGSDTTASTLTDGILRILQDPDVERKLVESLRSAFPNKETVELKELEKVDYLMGCVKEAIRLGMAVPGRLPRIVPGDGATPFVVDGQLIPPGTIVSMSAYSMNTNEDLWGPDALEFNPERWIGDGAKALDQHFCTFSKGARQCIGINVAHAEIYLVMGTLFLNFKMSQPKDWQAPRKIDVFTMQQQGHGLSINFQPL